jgi:regulator of sirC expression with transglutaminase-like and TPR domain
MTASSRARFADVVRTAPDELALACLLMAVEADPGIDIAAVQARLAALADAVPDGPSPAWRLRQVLGEFHGTATDFRDLRSSLLPDVVERRRGLPIMLSVLWLDIARRIGVRAVGLGLEGHFVVALGTDSAEEISPGQPDVDVVDPFAGGAAFPLDSAVRPMPPVQILHRILRNIAAWADRPERTPTALWACELGLLLPRHPAELRRRRAELLVRSGRFIDGASEFDEFADAIENADSAAAEKSRVSARLARARLN